MKLKEKELKIAIHDLFKIKTTYKFNCIRLGTAFKKDLRGLVVGGEDGIIRLYDMSSPVETKSPQILLETKGGPIQTMAIHDVTKFYNDDLVTGDSVGMVTVFCNQQILCRHSLAKDSIKCLQIHKDLLGNCSIVTSDESGYICAILPSKELWRININNLPVLKGPSEKAVVTCLLSTELVTPTGEKCSYILAADDSKRLHFVQQGEVVMTLITPEVVTAMCTGLFIDSDKLEIGQEAGSVKSLSQVALGCNNGAIYILHNFTITEEEFGNCKYHITNLICHPCSNLKVDLILCAGHFNALHVYHEGKKVGHLETPEWINSMDMLCINKDRKPEIVVGCLDNSIIGINLLETYSGAVIFCPKLLKMTSFHQPHGCSSNYKQLNKLESAQCQMLLTNLGFNTIKATTAKNRNTIFCKSSQKPQGPELTFFKYCLIFIKSNLRVKFRVNPRVKLCTHPRVIIPPKRSLGGYIGVTRWLVGRSVRRSVAFSLSGA